MPINHELFQNVVRGEAEDQLKMDKPTIAKKVEITWWLEFQQKRALKKYFQGEATIEDLIYLKRKNLLPKLFIPQRFNR